MPAFVSADNWTDIEADTAMYGRIVKVKIQLQLINAKSLQTNTVQSPTASIRRKANAVCSNQ